MDCGETEVFSSPLTIVYRRLQKHNEVTVRFSIFLQCKLGIPANPLPYGYWGRGGWFLHQPGSQRLRTGQKSFRTSRLLRIEAVMCSSLQAVYRPLRDFDK